MGSKTTTQRLRTNQTNAILAPIRLCPKTNRIQLMSESPPPKPNQQTAAHVTIQELQDLIRKMYYEKDLARGVPGTFMWLMEEIGELSSALRENDQSPEGRKQLAAEFADVIAWLVTIANVADIDLTKSLQDKYGSGCPGCGSFNCQCPDEEKP